MPVASALDRRVVAESFFRDAYRAPLAKPEASVVDIFFAVFGHHPGWMKGMLILRNRFAAAAGLETPRDAEILHPQRCPHYAVGDKIGPWPIFALTEAELIAGRDNRHLDFRLSVLREPAGAPPAAVISTVCTTHNLFGRVYLRCVIPFHRWGVQKLISRALAAGRL